MRCLYMPLVRLASSLYYETWVHAEPCAVMSQMRLTSSGISANAPITKTSTRPPLALLSAATICPSEPGGWPFELVDPRRALEVVPRDLRLPCRDRWLVLVDVVVRVGCLGLSLVNIYSTGSHRAVRDRAANDKRG